MAYSAILASLGVVIELVIFSLGFYAGYARRKPFGYLFAFTFLVFAADDFIMALGVSTDILAIVNILAVLSALAGLYLAIQDPVNNISPP